MRNKNWLWGALLALPLAAAALALAGAAGPADAAAQGSGVVCPLTGEELPCPNCCPLNGQ